MYIYNSVSCLAHETFPPLGMFKRLSHGIVEGEMANERKKSAHTTHKTEREKKTSTVKKKYSRKMYNSLKQFFSRTEKVLFSW